MGLKKFLRKVAPFAGPLIGAATSLLSGKTSQRANTAAANQEYERQKEFARMGIRWKVEDAKAAGLHPLFALGAQTSSYSPVAVQDSRGPALAEAGQNISRAIAAVATPAEREMARLAMRQAQNAVTQGDLSNEQLRLQNRQLENELLLAPVTMPSFEQPNIDYALGNVDAARRAVATSYQTVPGDSSLAEGRTPMWRTFDIGNGRAMVLPGGMQGDAAEVLESLAESPTMMLAVLEENRQRYGKEFSDWMFDRYFKSPLRRQVEKVVGPYDAWRRDQRFQDNTLRRESAPRRSGSGKRWKQVR